MELDKTCNNLDNVEQIDSELAQEFQLESDIQEENEIDSSIEGLTEVSIQYSGENTDNIEMIVNNQKGTISANIVATQYKSKLEFPNVGSERLIYVDLSENSLWRFDKEKLIYICVGRDYSELDTINGGNA